MSDILPLRPKTQNPDPTTHTRIYIPTLEKLRRVATRWNTTMQEANRYLIDLADAGQIIPEQEEVKPTP